MCHAATRADSFHGFQRWFAMAYTGCNEWLMLQETHRESQQASQAQQQGPVKLTCRRLIMSWLAQPVRHSSIYQMDRS